MPLSELPSIDGLLREAWVEAALAGLSRPVAVAALRAAVESARSRLKAGGAEGFGPDDVKRAVDRLARPSLGRVLNLTGVVLHTNLGRAPLAQRARDRVAQATGYCNLELDLDEGGRGSRSSHVRSLLCALTGAESALVVNNCAAAVLLALTGLGQGKSAVISRGELVEIGGGFRVPDVMRQAGLRLVEVGTTNRTRLDDYAQAIAPDTALLVRVHRSNFALVGFQDEPSTAELAGLAKERGLTLFEDLGSGALEPLHAPGVPGEPTVGQVLAAGSHLVAFSGDKLLGGPQAGILAGSRALIEQLERHPLNRALRPDKLTFAALEATLELYRDGLADAEVPARALAATPLPVLEARAQALAAALAAEGVACRVVEVDGKVGGGAMPLAALPGRACAISGDIRALQEALRQQPTPVIARVGDEQLLLDVRCLLDDDVGIAAAHVGAAVRKVPC
ncbi:MAG: L-seryl-tRNA(Sec) selenium transferase [Myxococcaceae bacterium]|nr:L-seryl-tRNA(Sec) selenium transferase [Myxococcaceae bacterium]